MKTVISMTLDTDSIRKAQKALEAYQKRLVRKTGLLLEALLAEGVTITHTKILDFEAFEDGELYNSVHAIMYVKGKVGAILIDSEHAAFVEFGTGVVGLANSYPYESDIAWQYNTNPEGKAHENDGWWYIDPNTGRRRFTKGMASRPFVYESAKLLETRIEKIAREVFAT